MTEKVSAGRREPGKEFGTEEAVEVDGQRWWGLEVLSPRLLGFFAAAGGVHAGHHDLGVLPVGHCVGHVLGHGRAHARQIDDVVTPVLADVPCENTRRK